MVLCGEEGEEGPGEGGEGGGEGGLEDLGFGVVHEVAAGAHGAEDGGVGDGRALVAEDAAIFNGGKTYKHEEIRVGDVVGLDQGPGEGHGEGEDDSV